MKRISISLKRCLYRSFFGETGVYRSENLDKRTKPFAEKSLTIEENDRIYGFAVRLGRIVIRTERELLAIGEKADSP